jgi:hypothetical protein
LHRGKLLSKHILDPFVVLGHIEENLRQVTAQYFVLRHETLLVRITSRSNRSIRVAVFSDPAHAFHRRRLGSDCCLHAGHLPHNRNAAGADVDALAIVTQFWEAFDDSYIGSRFGLSIIISK